MASLPLLLAVILFGMAVHRVFFPAHWRRWFSEPDEWLSDDELESYRRWSAPVLLLAAAGCWAWFLSVVQA